MRSRRSAPRPRVASTTRSSSPARPRRSSSPTASRAAAAPPSPRACRIRPRRFPLPVTHLVAEERTLKGSYIGTCVPARDLPRYVALYRQGRLPVDKLLTHRLKLDDINAGFERLRTGQAIRQVVMF